MKTRAILLLLYLYLVVEYLALYCTAWVSSSIIAPSSKRRKKLLTSRSSWKVQEAPPSPQEQQVEEVDVIVVGSGIGGLSCAALSAKYGFQTLCLECHDTAGGVAHSFVRYSSASRDIPFCFDSGPSLISGLSHKGTNPLRQVLDAVGTINNMNFQTYNGWMVHDLADGKSFKVTTGDGIEFAHALEEKAGSQTRIEFEQFRDKLLEPRGLSEASTYIPPFALRGGLGVVATLAKYTFKLLSIGLKGTYLTGPFSKVMDDNQIKDAFLRKWFDYLAFALSGLDAAHTQAAPVVYMMRDLHASNTLLDYPMGGMGALIDAFVAGIDKHGGELRLNSLVEKFILEPDSSSHAATCHGVVLDNGKIIRARRGVVCNAPLWNMAKILQDSLDDDSPNQVCSAVDKVQQNANDLCMTGSFMHLHLGIPKKGLSDDLECHHSVLDFSRNVTAEQNMVIISIPTVFDPSLAPDGYHIVHAYTAACDSFEPWKQYMTEQRETGMVGVSPNVGTAANYRQQEGYATLKDQRAQVLWNAVECIIPDVRQRAQEKGAIALVGTPLTHRRYNQRFRGTYGPAPSPDKDVWELGGAITPIRNLLACGGELRGMYFGCVCLRGRNTCSPHTLHSWFLFSVFCRHDLSRHWIAWSCRQWHHCGQYIGINQATNSTHERTQGTRCAAVVKKTDGEKIKKKTVSFLSSLPNYVGVVR